ncbi:IPTL-CTERM sorting domain-containing protein [Kineobactrum salinum]|uniref:IPTL-CTERM sorting domain-containing protein n=1 Tax=Kineobactrum salinum TaxID=2708301 RepID=A0A6C0U877_9GAMM|nr:IPTL-CTERM sorting domain-containing protein [Kineobactrum salinum]QIB65704.1 IPTL-CTERM sorting domain-containing protein [Kineobactrum salinum]
MAHAQIVVPEGGILSVPPGGSLDLSCSDLVIEGAVAVSDGQLTSGGTIDIATTGELTSGSGDITLGGDWLNAGAFSAGTGTVLLIDDCGAPTATFVGNTVFHNLTLVSATGRNFIFPAGSNITVNGTLTLQGAPGQPISLSSSSGATAIINLGPAAQLVSANAIVPPTVQIGETAAGTVAIPVLGNHALVLLALLMLVVAGVRLQCSSSIPIPTRRHCNDRRHSG